MTVGKIAGVVVLTGVETTSGVYCRFAHAEIKNRLIAKMQNTKKYLIRRYDVLIYSTLLNKNFYEP